MIMQDCMRLLLSGTTLGCAREQQAHAFFPVSLLWCCLRYEMKERIHTLTGRLLVQTHGKIQASIYPIGAVYLHTVKFKASSNGIGCCLAEFFNELHHNNSRSAKPGVSKPWATQNLEKLWSCS